MDARWIPVEERLPDHGGTVVCRTQDRQLQFGRVMTVGKWNGGELTETYRWMGYPDGPLAVTHWFPLPPAMDTERPLGDPEIAADIWRQRVEDYDNLIERLRDRAFSFKAPDELSAEAADAIEVLAQELARLRDKHERLRGICGETAPGFSL